MLEGCEHCGMVVERRDALASVSCPECGRPLRAIDRHEARILGRERRIAEQFRRASRLSRAIGARRDLGSRG